MMVALSRYSTMIKCDAPSCSSVFPTASWRSLARTQARDLGWSRVPPWTLAVEDSPRRRLDACPAHTSSAQDAIRARKEERAKKRDERERRRLEKLLRQTLGQTSSAQTSAAPEAKAPRGRRASDVPSNLDVVEKILRARGGAMTVSEIVEAAVGEFLLPTQSKTPWTVVSRDLALDVRRGDSRFVRTAPGTFALRSSEEI